MHPGGNQSPSLPAPSAGPAANQYQPIEPLAVAYVSPDVPDDPGVSTSPVPWPVRAPAYGGPSPYGGSPPGLLTPSPPARRRRRWWVWFALGLVAGAAIASPSWADRLGAHPASVRAVQKPTPTPPPTPAVVTRPGDRTPERGRELHRLLNVAVSAQAKALLDANEADFLNLAGTPGARTALQRRFRNLVAMRVSRLDLGVELPNLDTTAGQWRASLRYQFCFVAPACTPDSVTELAVWRDADTGPQLVSLALPKPDNDDWFGRVQPWETTDLQVLVGNRTVVATTSALKGRLPGLLAEAEKAAAVADGFATGTKPDVYRVFLAGSNEWRTWYGGVDAKWAAGVTHPIGPTHNDVVVNSSAAPGGYLDDLLRHEMTHAATIHGEHWWQGNWWLLEGIAELAEHPAALTATQGSTETRRYIRSGWKRTLPGDEPAAKASLSTVAAQYGIAYLAVKRLDTRFGREKLLDFFDRVTEQGKDKGDASSAVFGLTWVEVEADLIKTIAAFR